MLIYSTPFRRFWEAGNLLFLSGNRIRAGERAGVDARKRRLIPPDFAGVGLLTNQVQGGKN